MLRLIYYIVVYSFLVISFQVHCHLLLIPIYIDIRIFPYSENRCIYVFSPGFIFFFCYFCAAADNRKEISAKLGYRRVLFMVLIKRD